MRCTPGVVTADELPASVRKRCGAGRSTQLEAFITDAIEWFVATGQVGLSPDVAGALDDFRSFNFDRIYLRPASQAQANAVVRLLRALVEHLVAHPRLMRESQEADADLVRVAVGYVAGMTDRYACRLARQELDYPADDLPRGIDIPT